MDSRKENPLETWSAPQCPFTVEYAPRVLDDIRLAVVDAFFSLPRGGAEIGGVLLGSFDNGRLIISDYAAFDCEHALGPTFTLSPHDHTRLEELLAESARNAADRRPVGWYHSHTRSDLFLSEADREIHARYFQEPWQTALVLRPHTVDPTRAGFFFRLPDGSMPEHCPYGELTLEPLHVRPAPAGLHSERAAQSYRPEPDRRVAEGPAIEVTATPLQEAPPPLVIPPVPPPVPPPPVRRPEPAPEPAPTPIPSFLNAEPERSHKKLYVALAAIAAVAALGAGGFFTRDAWLPRLTAMVKTKPSAPPPVILGLNAIDLAGQLQIRWNGSLPSLRGGRAAVLRIIDGASPQLVELDATHLQAGVFTYTRQSEKVDVTLTVRLADGREAREATSFLGKPMPDIREGETSKLKSELDAQTERAAKLEKALKDANERLRKQQRRRLQNQDPGR